MEDHGQEKDEFDREDRIVTGSKLESASRTAKDEIKKSGGQQKADGDPREGLKRPAALIQNLDCRCRGQGMDRRPEDKEEKGNPP